MEPDNTATISQEETCLFVRDSEKELLFPKKPHRIIIPRDKEISKQYKLNFISGGSRTLSAKFRLHIVMPVTEMVFTLSCTVAKQERQVAQIKYDAIRSRWAEFRYDDHDYVFPKPSYYEAEKNLSSILSMVRANWKIQNLGHIPLVDTHTQGGLFNGYSRND